MEETRHFLALGDSYTIGEGVAPDEAWPHQLARMLGSRGIPLETQVIAKTGWTTGELLEAFSERSPAHNPALVTLMIGVNDQYRGALIEEFARGVQALLELAARAAAPTRTVVLSIPDWGVTPFADGRDRAAIAAAIDSFNHEAFSAARRAGAGWIDVTALSRRAAEDATLLAADGLHFSPLAHRLIAENVLPDAERILRSTTEGFARQTGSS